MGRDETEASSDPTGTTGPRGRPEDRPRLGYAGGTWRSVQSIGLDAHKAGLRHVFEGPHHKQSYAACSCRDDGGHAAEAAERSIACLIWIMMAVVAAVHMSGQIVPAMNMHVAREIVMKVNGTAQGHRGVRHEAKSTGRLRAGSQCTLQDERCHRQQHEAARDPSQARERTRLHASVVKQFGLENQAVHPGGALRLDYPSRLVSER